MILLYSGRFYKVIKVRSRGDNACTFVRKEIDSKKRRTVELGLYGFLNKADRDFSRCFQTGL
jgi:hypothetical protein